MPKLKAGTILPTDRENKEINLQAKEDDTLLTDKQLSKMKRIDNFPQLKSLAKRGRPLKRNPKKSTTIRLNAEVVDYFKAQGKGWQTSINDVLQKYVNSQQVV